MSKELTALVEKLWRDGTKTEAEAVQEVGQLLTESSRKELRAILHELEARALTQQPNTDRTATSLGKLADTTVDLPTDESARVLLLLTLGIHHSDSLTLLPRDMRQARLDTWAQLTKFHIDLVKEAATLGPAGLGKLLEVT